MDAFPEPASGQSLTAKLAVYVFSALAVLAIAMSPGIKSAGQLPVLLMFLLSLLFCFRKPNFNKGDYLLVGALALMMFSAIPQAIISQQGQPVDGPSRYFIAATIFIALSHIRTSPKLILYGAIGSALITLAAGITELRINNNRLDLGIGIIESGTVLNMMVFIMLPFLWAVNQLKLRLLIFLAITICITFMFLTGARGAWLAAMFTGSVFIFLKFTENRLKIFLSLIIGCSLIATIAYHSSERVADRFNSSVKEISMLHDTSIPTSTNLRLNMWQQAIEGFKRGPWIGISYAENIELKNEILKQKDPKAYYNGEGRDSAHNEILNSMLYKGIFGLIALLLLYLVPLWNFIKYLKDDSVLVQALAQAGVCCVTSAFISGLTEAPLMHTSVATTFAMIIILITHSIHQARKQANLM